MITNAVPPFYGSQCIYSRQPAKVEHYIIRILCDSW